MNAAINRQPSAFSQSSVWQRRGRALRTMPFSRNRQTRWSHIFMVPFRHHS